MPEVGGRGGRGDRTSRSSAEGEGRREVGREEVGALQVEQGGSLSDLVALNIGQIGENLALGRCEVMGQLSAPQHQRQINHKLFIKPATELL